MENDQLLERLAERYRGQGYKVTVNPDRSVLPPFARGYTVELLAERAGGNVLVSAKPTQAEIARDETIVNLADLVGKQPGWRFDVTLLRSPAPPPRAVPRDAVDMSRAGIEETAAKALRMYDGGFESQAVVAAWSAFESAMRRRRRSTGREAGPGASPQGMLNELVSEGEIDHAEFHDLQGGLNLRELVVGGFEPPAIDRGDVELPGAIARRLLEEIEAEPSPI